MPEWQYQPGPLPAIASATLVVALGGQRASECARGLLARVPPAQTIEDVIGELVTMTGMRELPAFFLAATEKKRVRFLIRGGFTAAVTSAAGREQLTDKAARTWAEFEYDEDVSLEVTQTIGEPVPASPSRVAQGAIAISSLSWGVAAAPPQGASEITKGYVEPSVELIDPPALNTPVLAPPPLIEPPVPTSVEARVTEFSVPPRSAKRSVGTYDALFGGVTVVGNIEGAAVRETIADEDARTPDTETFDASTSAVSAVMCDRNHANPPERSTCWKCAASLSQGSVVRMPRPSLGKIVLDDGREVPLNRSVLIGRNPRADRTDAAGIPELVKVPSPRNDVSRTHARIFLDGWQVILEDLGSTNGTLVLTTDGRERRIRAGEPAILSDGARVDLGDGATFTVVGVP